MTKNIKILVIEDDLGVIDILNKNLVDEDYDVALAYDGKKGIELAQKYKYDIILLDVIMPYKNGIEICKELKQDKGFNTPILMLTALGSSENIIEGLDSGADDYVSKPISPKVFLSRVNALFRRLNKKEAKVLEIDNLTIDPERFVIQVDKNDIVLAKKEFELLHLLAQKPGRVFLRNEILNQVWGNDVIVGDRTIDVHIRKIRQKLGIDCITTVKGVGYKFEL